MDTFNPKCKAGIITKERLGAVTLEWKRSILKDIQPPSTSTWQFREAASDLVSTECKYIPCEEDDVPEEYKQVLEAGFVVGACVKLQKRITGSFVNKGKELRKDVPMNAVGTIKDVPIDDSRRVNATFRATVRHGDLAGKDVGVDVSVSVDDLQMETSTPGQPTMTASGKTPKKSAGADGVFTTYPFLRRAGCEEVPIVYGNWGKRQSLLPYESAFKESRARTELCMQIMHSKAEQKQGPAELLIARRGKRVEVWTLVKFKKFKLEFFPYTTEIKDKYWTHGKSNLIETPKSYPRGKHVVIDGRLASKLPEDDQKMLCLFWVIDRTQTKDEANLHIYHATTSIDIKVQLSTGSKRTFSQMSGEDANVKVPYLSNPVDIDAHTLLVALDDANLVKAASTAQDK